MGELRSGRQTPQGTEFEIEAETASLAESLVFHCAKIGV